MSERPPWYKVLERAKYDGAMQTYKEIQARVVPQNIRDDYDIDVPESWREQPALYLLRGLGVGKRGLPPGSGVGLVQSPYADIYTKVYGVNPLADLPLYRKIYRSQPDVQNAIQMQVNLAVGKGFTISHKDPKVIEFIEQLCERINLGQHLTVMATDALVYGNAYTEIQWDKIDEKNEQIYEYQGENYTANDIANLNIPTNEVKAAVFKEENKQDKNFIAKSTSKDKKARTIVALKDLDPLYMRVRRDSYGNQFGFIQWLAFPPILIDNESCIHIKYRPASWGYESAYGTSHLMPIIKNNELLMQFENDASVWVHSRAIPPLIVKGGTPEKPYSTAQMNDLMGILKTRTAATMIFTKGDVVFEELKTIASDLNLGWWLDYLLLRRYQSLGIPPILMGKTDKGGSRGTAEVLLHDFIAKLQALQEFIADPIETYIFKPLIIQKFGKDTANVKIIWKPIIEEDKNMRSQRLIQMQQAGSISINELRMEMGFSRIAESKYDKLEADEPKGFSTGFPPKPGFPQKPGVAQPKPGETAPVAKPKQTPDLSRATQQSKSPPEGRMKMEEIKAKKMELLQIDEQFREKMMDLTRKTKFDLKDDAKLVKNVKFSALEEAESILNDYLPASYLINKMGAEDDLQLKEEDLKPLSEMKKKCLTDFEQVIDSMVSKKENGMLD